MKKNENKSVLVQVEDAQQEAYKPTAMLLQGQDFVIRTCDGDQEYVYLALMRKSTYLVTEVYPGLSKKRTTVREAEELSDLVFSSGKHKNVEAVVNEITSVVFDGFEFETPTTNPVRLLRAAN